MELNAEIDRIQELEATWNKTAHKFNDGLREDAHVLVLQAIDIALDGVPPADEKQFVELLCLFRFMAWQLKDSDAVLSLDKLLDPYLGNGLVQFKTEDDVALRAAAISVLSAYNESSPDTIERLGEFAAGYMNDRYSFLSSVDVFETIRSVCIDSDEAELERRCDQILLTLHAQNQKMIGLKQCMPQIRADAIDYPSSVTIETFSKCNAKCSFCPYPDMELNGDRVGTKMSVELFQKIISDLSAIPSDHVINFNLSRVNEPLLDKRIFDFIDHIADHLPQCTVSFPSNGSTLSKRNIQKLSDRPSFKAILISLNATDKETYKDVMGLDFDKTLKNLDNLHAMHAEGEIPFDVKLTAVVGPDQRFDTEWCQERYPLFASSVYYATNWFGLTDNATASAQNLVASCKDWYQIHILADGNEALCCYDALGKYGEGNARDINMLDLYNLPWRKDVRRKISIRQSPETPDCCKRCSYT